MIVVRFLQEFDFMIGDSAIEIFTYFGVEKMHGLNIKDCMKRINDGGTYIDGLANYNPHDHLAKPFVFINRKAIKKNHHDVTLLMHELMHMALLLHDWDISGREEEIITWAEEQTNRLYEFIR